MLRQFARNARLAGNASDLFGNINSRAQRAGEDLYRGLQRGFVAQVAEGRTQLFEGLITKGQFARMSAAAAKEFNDGLIRGLRDLESRGLITPQTFQALSARFKEAGLTSGSLFAQQFIAGSEKAAAVGAALTKSLTLPLVAAGGAALKFATDLESAMIQVEVRTQATGEQFAALRKQARQLGAETQFTATDAANAMSLLAQSAFDANEILAATPGVLNLAASANLDMAQAADIATNILTGYNKEVSDLNHINDALVKTTLLAKVSVEQIGEAMKIAAPIASRMGIDFDELTAAIGLLGRAGLRATVAGTGLRGAMSRLASPTKEAAKLMDDLGVNVLDAQGNIRSLAVIVDQFAKSGATAGQILEIFGDRAGPAMAALISQGSKALIDFQVALKNAGGTAKRIGDANMRGMRGAVRELQSALEELAHVVADAGLLKFATNFVRAITDMTRAMGQLSPGVVKFVTVLAGILAVVGPLIFGLSKLSGGIVTLGAAVINVGSKVLAGGSLFAAMTPTGWVFLAIVATIGVVYGLVKGINALNEALGNGKKDVSDYGRAFTGLNANVIAVQAGALAQKIAELEAIRKEMAKTDESIGHKITMIQGVPVVTETRDRTTRLKKLDQEIAAYREMSVVAQKAFTTATDGQIKLAAEAAKAAEDVQKLIDAMNAGATGGKGGPEETLKQLIARVRDLMQLQKEAADLGSPIPELSNQLVASYDTLNRLLAEQKDQWSDVAIEIRKTIAQLKQIESVQVLRLGAKIELPPLSQMKIPKPPPAAAIALPFKFDPLKPEDVVALQKAVDALLAGKPITFPVGFKPPDPGLLQRFKDRLAPLLQAKDTLDLAKASGDRQQLAKAQAAFNAQLAVAVDLEKKLALATLGTNATAEQRKAVLDAIEEMYKAIGKEGEKTITTSQKLADTLDKIGQVGSAIASVADAIGGMSEQSQRTIRQVERLFDSLVGLGKAIASGDIFGMITSGISTIASLVGLITGSSAKAANQEILKENNQRLQELSQDLAGFSNSLGQMMQESRAITNSAILAARRPTTGFARGMKDVEALNKELIAAGTSIGELKRRAEELGITITDANGRISAEGLDKLNEALILSAKIAMRWGDTLDQQREKLSLRQEVEGVDMTPVQKMINEFTLLSQLAPDIAKMFDLTGIDFASQEGQQKLRNALIAMVDAIENGTIPLEAMGKLMSKDELIAVIRNFDSALDDAADAADELTANLLNVPDFVKINRQRFAAIDPAPLTNAVDDLKNTVATLAPTTSLDTSDLEAVMKALKETMDKPLTIEPPPPIDLTPLEQSLNTFARTPLAIDPTTMTPVFAPLESTFSAATNAINPLTASVNASTTASDTLTGAIIDLTSAVGSFKLLAPETAPTAAMAVDFRAMASALASELPKPTDPAAIASAIAKLPQPEPVDLSRLAAIIQAAIPPAAPPTPPVDLTALVTAIKAAVPPAPPPAPAVDLTALVTAIKSIPVPAPAPPVDLSGIIAAIRTLVPPPAPGLDFRALSDALVTSLTTVAAAQPPIDFAALTSAIVAAIPVQPPLDLALLGTTITSSIEPAIVGALAALAAQPAIVEPTPPPPAAVTVGQQFNAPIEITVVAGDRDAGVLADDILRELQRRQYMNTGSTDLGF